MGNVENTKHIENLIKVDMRMAKNVAPVVKSLYNGMEITVPVAVLD